MGYKRGLATRSPGGGFSLPSSLACYLLSTVLSLIGLSVAGGHCCISVPHWELPIVSIGLWAVEVEIPAQGGAPIGPRFAPSGLTGVTHGGITTIDSDHSAQLAPLVLPLPILAPRTVPPLVYTLTSPQWNTSILSGSSLLTQ